MIWTAGFLGLIGDVRNSTVNLKSPVIINHKTNLAVQVILDQDYPYGSPYSARRTAYADFIQEKANQLKLAMILRYLCPRLKATRCVWAFQRPAI